MASIEIEHVSSGVMKERITYLKKESKSFLAVGKLNFQNYVMDGWQVRKQARIRSGLTQEDIGKKFDPPISRVAVAHWEKPAEQNGNAPDQKKLKILSDLYGLTAGQLLGQEPVDFLTTRIPFGLGGVEPDKYIEVQSLDNPVGAGGELLKDYDEVDGHFAFRRSFFTKRGLIPEMCKMVTASGRSMSPLINHGDRVMVNIADKRIIDGEIYVFRTTEELKIKRLFKQLDGKIRVESDNKEFRDEYITPDFPAEIVGRFVIRFG